MSSPMPVTELTLKRVRRDCARNAKGRPFISAIALFLALIGAGFTARYLDGDHHDFLIAGLILFAAAAGISLLGRLFTLRMNKKLSSGEIRFIRSCVDDMKLDGADDEWGKVYLHFSLGPDGRYISRTSVRGDKVKLGEPYYLVLDKDRKGKLYVLAFYSAQEFQPDAQLRELLVRDVRLTGEQISREALQKRETKATFEKLIAEGRDLSEKAKKELPSLSGEQVDALPGRYIRLKKAERFLSRTTFLSPIVFLVLGLLFLLYLKDHDSGAAWYIRLVYTLVLLLCCYGTIILRLLLEKRSDRIFWLLRAAGIPVPKLPEAAGVPWLGGIGCLLHAGGYFFSAMGHFFNALILFLVWFGG